MSNSGNVSTDDPDAYQRIDYCEGCDNDDQPLRAIKMKEGRRRRLCRGCFIQKAEDGEVDPTDPRMSGP